MPLMPELPSGAAHLLEATRITSYSPHCSAAVMSLIGPSAALTPRGETLELPVGLFTSDISDLISCHTAVGDLGFTQRKPYTRGDGKAALKLLASNAARPAAMDGIDDLFCFSFKFSYVQLLAPSHRLHFPPGKIGPLVEGGPICI